MLKSILFVVLSLAVFVQASQDAIDCQNNFQTLYQDRCQNESFLNCLTRFQNVLSFKCLPVLQDMIQKTQQIDNVANPQENLNFGLIDPTEKTIREMFQYINASGSTVKTLTISCTNCANISRLDLSAIYGLTSLQQFKFSLISGKVNLVQGLRFLLEARSNLKVISISVAKDYGRVQINDVKYVQRITSLEKLILNLQHAQGYSPIDFSKFTNLRQLNVGLVGSGQKTFNLSNLSQLRQLGIQCVACEIDNLNFLNAISSYTKLNLLNLDFSKNNLLNDMGPLSVLQNLTNLYELQLKFDNSDIQGIQPLSNISALQLLKYVEISLVNNRISDFKPLADGIFPIQDIRAISINIHGNLDNNEQYGCPNIKKLFDQQYDSDKQIIDLTFVV